jgi:hypothetical protein
MDAADRQIDRHSINRSVGADQPKTVFNYTKKKCLMDFLPIASPQSESELAVMVSLLDAHDIHHFVQNRSFGGLYPGMQIGLFNARRLMVRADHAEQARELLAMFIHPSMDVADEITTGKQMTLMDRLRVVAEIFIFGWCFPNRRRKIQDTEDADT